MPAAYAHLRFGEEVLELLPSELSARLREEPELFRLGLIGPDFLFFYRPVLPNAVIPLGRKIHSDAGLRFFAHGGKVLARKGFPPQHFAYLCGVICHFALDSACHGYISSFIARYGVGHIELEHSLDRALMRLDGKDPRVSPLAKLTASRGQSAVMADFYRGLSPETLRRAVSSAAFYGDLFYRFRNFVGLKLCPIICGEECSKRKAFLKKGRIAVMRRFRSSLGTAVRLICSLEASAQRREKWDSAYRNSFSGKKVL